MNDTEIIINGQTYVRKDTETEQTKQEEKIVWIAIKNRFTGSIIFQSSKTTYREAINECIEEALHTWANADLTNAKLTNADLTRADLTNADLTRADLTNADLTDANLTNADLTDANLTACQYYMGRSNENFEALCKAIKTIKWNGKTGADFIK